MPDRFRSAALAVTLAFAAACVPAPTGNEVNFADEGMAQGVAAASRTPRSELDRVTLGRAENADHTIRDATRTFAAGDTVYASARVRGPANSAIVRAVWYDAQGQPVDQETRIVSPSSGETVALGGAPGAGWSPGGHTLELFLDDRLMATERFTVEGAPRNAAPEGTPPAH